LTDNELGFGDPLLIHRREGERCDVQAVVRRLFQEAIKDLPTRRRRPSSTDHNQCN
jgi:hypothetical protein